MESVDNVNRDTYTKKVHTHSNLNLETMHEICATIGLPSTQYASHETLIDKMLLSRRNYIAHGSDVPVAATELAQLIRSVFNLMRQFQTQIENAAVQDGFLKPTGRVAATPA